METPAPVQSPIRADDPHPRKQVQALDSHINYVDMGEGDPIVFLHGNPTSSYLWRNVISHLGDIGRCLAPDLLGMGRSGKSPARDYRLANHIRYLDAWFDALDLTRNVTLVVHDWGAALGFHRACRFPAHIKGVVYMEGMVLPRRWEDFDQAAAVFKSLRSPGGERLVLEENFFVETILPRGIIRKLSEAEMAIYRAPFAKPEDRLPTLTWPRQIPIEGEPPDVTELVQTYSAAMAQSRIPKLLIKGDPGAIIRGRTLDFCRTWTNQTEVTVKGIHFLAEDSPHEIGQAVLAFVKNPGQ